MNKKFKVLRFIGTLWKILAWIILIIGVISAFAILLVSIFSGGVGSQMEQVQGEMAWAPWAFGFLGGIIGFIGAIIITLFYFLVLYAIGELIYLFLSIEENTRRTAQWIQAQTTGGAAYPPTAPR